VALMDRQKVCAALLLHVAACVSASAWATDAAPPAPTEIQSLEPVLVEGVGKALVLSRSNLAQAVDVFRTKKAQLAPQAQFRFSLMARQGAAPLEQAQARAVADETGEPFGEPLSADAELRFDAEALLARLVGRSALRFDQSAAKASLLPEVRSAGATAQAVRLGDLRLQCEVLWALRKAEAPLMARMAFGAVGGPCHSSRIAMFTTFGQAIQSARLVEGERVLPLSASGKQRMSLLVPLHDASWSNEAQVLIVPVPTSAVVGASSS
jgi:hypothetical protein